MKSKELDNLAGSLEHPKRVSDVLELEEWIINCLKHFGWNQEKTGLPGIDNDPEKRYWVRGDLVLKLDLAYTGLIEIMGKHQGFQLAPNGITTSKLLLPIAAYPKKIGNEAEWIRLQARTVRKHFLETAYKRSVAFIEEITFIEENGFYYFLIPDEIKAAVNLKKAVEQKEPTFQMLEMRYNKMVSKAKENGCNCNQLGLSYKEYMAGEPYMVKISCPGGIYCMNTNINEGKANLRN